MAKLKRYYVLHVYGRRTKRTKWTCDGNAVKPIPAVGKKAAIEALKLARKFYPRELYRLSRGF